MMLKIFSFFYYYPPCNHTLTRLAPSTARRYMVILTSDTSRRMASIPDEEELTSTSGVNFILVPFNSPTSRTKVMKDITGM